MTEQQLQEKKSAEVTEMIKQKLKESRKIRERAEFLNSSHINPLPEWMLSNKKTNH
ncbi:MAG: hypothetical protein LBM27_02285 [Lactobacillaceae bacterium]|jgi:hypothetical protein|nr:hypothetical protein [Lactobacillaceae bacterium]